MLQHGAQRKVTKLRDGPVPVIEGGGRGWVPFSQGPCGLTSRSHCIPGVIFFLDSCET